MNGPLVLASTMLGTGLVAYVAVLFATAQMLPWRTSHKISTVSFLLDAVGCAVLSVWLLVGFFGGSTVIFGFFWWKHRNDDDDDETKRRRRRVGAKLKSLLPKPKAFVRPVPAQS